MSGNSRKNKELFGFTGKEKKDDEVQGKQHFVLFDDEKLLYDFDIKEESPAYEKKIGRRKNL